MIGTPLAIGDTLPERQFGPITLTDIVRYQGASGDMNPMHHDDEAARAAGYREAFSVGMLGGGYLAAFCTDLFGTDAVRRFRLRFRQLSWRGDVLTASGRVVDYASEHGETTVGIDFALTNHDGVVVIEGSGRFAVNTQH